MNFLLALLLTPAALPLTENCAPLGCDPALFEIEQPAQEMLEPSASAFRPGGTIALGLGLGMLAAGLVGFFTTPDCATWDHRGRCSGIGEPAPWISISFFLGLGLSVSSYAWIRQDAVE